MRVEFPEYRRWQNAMRPEDRGARDGEAKVPAAGDTSCVFVEQLRSRLRNLLGVTRNYFAEEESRLWPLYESAIARYKQNRADYSRKNQALGRGIEIPVSRRHAVAMLAVAALLLVMTAVTWLLHRGLSVWAACVAAIALTAAVLGSAYLVGLVLRQARSLWIRMAAALAAVCLVGAFGWVALRLLAQDPAEAVAVVCVLSVAASGVAALAFLSHDADPGYEAIHLALERSRAELMRIVSMRRENREYHLNCARRHAELAGEMLARYCAVNQRLRADKSLPAWMCELRFDTVSENDFALFGENVAE